MLKIIVFIMGEILPFHKFHLRGCSELLGKRAVSGRKLARRWQTRARMCSPDAQDSKKCWVGYHPGTLWCSAGPISKISRSLWRAKKFRKWQKWLLWVPKCVGNRSGGGLGPLGAIFNFYKKIDFRDFFKEKFSIFEFFRPVTTVC